MDLSGDNPVMGAIIPIQTDNDFSFTNLEFILPKTTDSGTSTITIIATYEKYLLSKPTENYLFSVKLSSTGEKSADLPLQLYQYSSSTEYMMH